MTVLATAPASLARRRRAAAVVRGRRSACVASVLLLAGVVAQDAPRDAQGRGGREVVLELCSSEPALVEAVVSLLQLPEDQRAPRFPGCYRIEIDDLGTARVQLEEPGDLRFRCRVRPGPLLDLMPAVARVAGGLLRGLAFQLLLDQGLSAMEAGRTLGALQRLPGQIETLQVEVRGDRDDGLRVELGLQPAADSWLAERIAGLRPAPRAVPHVALEPPPILELRGALEAEGLRAMAAPLLDHLAMLRARDRAQRAEHARIVEEELALLDGRLAFAITAGGARLRLLGVTDATAYRELLADPRTLAYLGRRIDGLQFQVAEAGEGLAQRQVRVLRAPDLDEDLVARSQALQRIQQQRIYTGTIGDMAFRFAGSEPERVVLRVVEDVEQDRIGLLEARRSLPADALVVGELRLPEDALERILVEFADEIGVLVAADLAEIVRPLVDGLPRLSRLVLRRDGSGLRLTLVGR